MSVSFKQLYQKVLLRIPRLDGRALLVTKEAVNDAQRLIARVQDFDELKTWKTSGSVTVTSQKVYHLETDLLLTRPKDVYSLKLMDGTNSRKLTWIDPRVLDNENPYPEGTAVQRSTHYTQRGLNVELIPIPDAAYTLHIFYSQWPLVLSADSDNMSFADVMQDVIVSLAAEMTNAILDPTPERLSTDWAKRAQAYVTGSVFEHVQHPDRQWKAKPFNPAGDVNYAGEYWKDPFIKGVR